MTGVCLLLKKIALQKLPGQDGQVTGGGGPPLQSCTADGVRGKRERQRALPGIIGWLAAESAGCHRATVGSASSQPATFTLRR